MMCMEKHVLVKNVYKWAKLFKEDQNSIQDESGWPTMASTLEMVDLVNALILADKRVTIEDISEWGISVATTHKIVHDNLVFSKVICQ